jgi:hypothetical protein
MTASIEISKLAEQLVALNLPDNAHQSFAVVIPIADGRAGVVLEFLAEGPPFDPSLVGLEHHQVFVTDGEVVFVFETAAGLKGFEQLLAEDEFWDTVASWERCAVDKPRVAAAAYEWPDGRRPSAS